jgi:hypothetical protein
MRHFRYWLVILNSYILIMWNNLLIYDLIVRNNMNKYWLHIFAVSIFLHFKRWNGWSLLVFYGIRHRFRVLHEVIESPNGSNLIITKIAFALWKFDIFLISKFFILRGWPRFTFFLRFNHRLLYIRENSWRTFFGRKSCSLSTIRSKIFSGAAPTSFLWEMSLLSNKWMLFR